MGVPLIVAVTPSSGLTRGKNVVRIDGAKFRLPAAPPAYGFVGGGHPLSVRVWFGDQECRWAEAATSQIIFCEVPQWRGDWKGPFPVALDVRVANCASDGTIITGEDVTKTDAYSVDRPPLAVPAMLQRVLDEVINLFKRHLIENVTMTISALYDSTPETDPDRLRAQAPVVFLVGPRLTADRETAIAVDQPYATGATTYVRKQPPVFANLEFQVDCWAKTARHAFSLMQAYLIMLRDVTSVQVLADPAQPNLGVWKYDFFVPFAGYPEMIQKPVYDDLYLWRSRCMIKGVQLDEEAGTIIEQGWTIEENDGEVTLQIVPFDAP